MLAGGRDPHSNSSYGQRVRQTEGYRPTEKNPHWSSSRPAPRLPDAVVQRIVKDRADGLSFGKIATALNDEQVATAHGGAKWYAATVAKFLDSLA